MLNEAHLMLLNAKRTKHKERRRR